MKEYLRGAFQALAWTRLILSNVKDMTQLEKTLSQIDQTLDQLRDIAAKDFPTDMQQAISDTTRTQTSREMH